MIGTNDRRHTFFLQKMYLFNCLLILYFHHTSSLSTSIPTIAAETPKNQTTTVESSKPPTGASAVVKPNVAPPLNGQTSGLKPPQVPAPAPQTRPHVPPVAAQAQSPPTQAQTAVKPAKDSTIPAKSFHTNVGGVQVSIGNDSPTDSQKQKPLSSNTANTANQSSTQPTGRPQIDSNETGISKFFSNVNSGIRSMMNRNNFGNRSMIANGGSFLGNISRTNNLRSTESDKASGNSVDSLLSNFNTGLKNLYRQPSNTTNGKAAYVGTLDSNNSSSQVSPANNSGKTNSGDVNASMNHTSSANKDVHDINNLFNTVLKGMNSEGNNNTKLGSNVSVEVN